MNTIRSPGIAFRMVMLLSLVLSGCYTQLETARDERYYGENYVAESDTTAVDSSGSEAIDNNYYNDDGYGYGWYPGNRIGFSYYYPSWYWPSYAFSAAYYNPWYGHHYWSYPFYGYYSGYYYDPYYYGYGYGYTGTGSIRGTRDFGSTRGFGGRRNTVSTGGYGEPLSGRKSMSSSDNRVSRGTKDQQRLLQHGGSRSERSSKSSQSYQPNRRSSRPSPSGSPRYNTGGRREGRSSPNGARSYAPTVRPSRPSFSAPRAGGGFRGGGFGGGTRSGGGGSRGGGSRSGRR